MAQSVEPTLCEICNISKHCDFCLDCGQYFCEQCKLIHSKFKSFRDHTFGDNMDLGNESEDIQLKCTEHNAEFIYCCKYCGNLICRTCYKTSHKGHTIADIDEALDRLVKDILDEKDTYQCKAKKVVLEIEKCKQKIHNFKIKCYDIESGVKMRLETATKQLEKITNQMLNEIAAVKNETLLTLNRSLSQLVEYNDRSAIVLTKLKFIEAKNQDIKSFKILEKIRREMQFCIPHEVFVPDIVHDDIHWNRTLQHFTGNIRIVDSTKKKDVTTLVTYNGSFELYDPTCRIPFCRLPR